MLAVALLIVVPSIRSLSPVRGLPLRDPLSSCESPEPAPHTEPQEARSIDRTAAASATFLPEPTPAQAPAVRVSRTELARGTTPACPRYRVLRTLGSGSSAQDFSLCALWRPATTPYADQKLPRPSDTHSCIPAAVLFPDDDCTTRTSLLAD